MSKSSSNIVRFNLKNKTKDIQGGEKKVMKKSLSVILSTAMALSMFSSVAFGKTSADFTDLKDLDAATKAKFDALISAGIFDGVSDTTFGLKDEMNRAQFAKVAALITGIEVNKDLKTSSFKDVKSDDAANGYALPYIEALKANGITDGYGEGTYNPAGKVTKEQLATFLVRVLGKDAEAKAKTGTDTTVTDWAQGYVALALELKLLPAGADGKFGGQANATRDLLLTGAYEAKAQYVSPGKVSVTAAKATGVKSVTVTFSKPVDTDKAKVALTKGNVAVATTAKFADDKKSVVLTLTDVKISDGSYTATLSGLDAAGVDKTTATFTGETEKVTKLSFVNASDKIAKSKSVTVRIKAENQYGEVASINGGSYTAYVLGESKSVTRNEDTGLLELKLNTQWKNKSAGASGVSGTDAEYQSELDVLPINVFLTNTSVSVQKTYKIGTEPIVSKIELGAAKYPNVKTSLTEAGDYAEFALSRFDQYGDVVDEGAVDAARTNYDAIITPYSFDALSVKKSASGGAYDKVRITLDKNTEKTGDYTATVYVGASSATATVKVESTKVANKVEFGSFTGVLAEGDGVKYIPIVAYDAAGNKLSASDIASNANSNRFAISVSGATIPADGGVIGSGPDTYKNGNAAIVQTGEHKGELKLTGVTATANSVVFVNVGIYSANVQNNAQQSFTVQSPRKPETIVLDGDKPAQKGIATSSTTVKWFVKDQYGEKLPNTITAYQNDYKVKVTVTDSTYANFTDGTVAHTFNGTGDQSYEVFAGAFGTDFNSKGLVLTAGSTPGTTKIKAQLIQVRDSNHVAIADNVLKTIDSSLTVVANSGLTYSVNAVKDLYAALDSSLTPAFDKVLTATPAPADVDGDGTVDYAFNSSLGRALAVSAKDKSGDAVKLPGGLIVSASSSNQDVVKTVQSGNEVTVIGNKAGKASVTVVYKTTSGVTADSTLDVNVKADQVVASTITADTTSSVTAASLAGLSNVKPNTILSGLKVVDNYGVEYTGTKLDKYRTFLGLQYVVTDVVGGTVTFNADGTVNISGSVTNFNIKAIANGKTVTAIVQ
ncbi:S-layer homology domain-containing protein [Paenibacillus alginolyticus]|uniref:S-layer homology domain-containing protein n=1 Tax=Paenibacillus alginolyticus TaxID=59839 RepID=A0ABT4GIS5_9BACL|nr:S-layer homology domain-containing protein [Paenibacillus alginolyticus]MCY9696107.1 S-layer homology domain-containing protein [Paenibacillus alginolyticus]MEC0143031.1 S-layer homology domain-containing protein [Paenibacillus alginolyticus]